MKGQGKFICEVKSSYLIRLIDLIGSISIELITTGTVALLILLSTTGSLFLNFLLTKFYIDINKYIYHKDCFIQHKY